jgi:hypothetical protein
MKPSPSLAAVALVAAAGLLLPAQAARVAPAEVEASSYYPPEGGFQYFAKQATDGKLSTAWVEGDDGSGLGSWIKVKLDGERTLTGLKVWGGLWYSYDFWTRANRPKTIEVKFSDGSTETLDLEDKMEAQVLTFSKPRTTSDVRIKVKAIYNGNTWFDTAISEIQLLDSTSPGHKAAASYAYSSKLADDGDGNYEPANLTDGVSDSMWCEGNAEGDGTGEWVEVRFDGAQEVSELHLINGVGGDFGAWMKSNRATKATLTFSDGSSRTVDLKNSISPQTISFPATTTRSVKVTVDEVYKGKEFNDLCFSELYFQ